MSLSHYTWGSGCDKRKNIKNFVKGQLLFDIHWQYVQTLLIDITEVSRFRSRIFLCLLIYSKFSSIIIGFVYDQNFFFFWGGGVDEEGGNSERCLKWGGGGSLKDLSKNILNRGWVKAKVVRREERVLKVSPPLPPGKF